MSDFGRVERRQEIALQLLRNGVPSDKVPEMAHVVANWVEETRINTALVKPKKKLGRPAKKLSAKTGKRKYTKKSAYWK